MDSILSLVSFPYSFPASHLEQINPVRKKKNHGPRPQGNYAMFVETSLPNSFCNKHREGQDQNQRPLQADVLLIAKEKRGATLVPLIITYYSDELRLGEHSCFFCKIHSLPEILVDQILAPIIHSYEIWCKLFSPPHEVEESSSWYWPRSTISLGFPHSSTLQICAQFHKQSLLPRFGFYVFVCKKPLPS